jgi:hypothetical protein
VKSTVEKLGFIIRMSYQLGEGNTFDIEVPILKASVLN